MRAFLGAIGAIAGKDLRAELRAKETISAMLLFAVLATLIFSFALELDRAARETAVSGVLWVTLVFAGMLGLNRSIGQEKDRGSFDGLLLAPIERSAIYFGKMLANLALMLIVGLVMIPLFTVLFSFVLFKPALVGVMILGIIGFAAVGTLLASMTVHTRAREMMLPILLLPVALPVVMASVRATTDILADQPPDMWIMWPQMLLAYDVIFLAIAYMLFDYVVEE